MSGHGAQGAPELHGIGPGPICDRVAQTPAKTPRGDAIKLLHANAKPDDEIMVRADTAPLPVIEGQHLAMLDTAKRQNAAGDDTAWEASLNEVFRLDEVIATTPATTLAEAAVKLRRLCDPSSGWITATKTPTCRAFGRSWP
jgi:hypothetical protein